MKTNENQPKLKRMMETAEICKQLKKLNHSSTNNNILTDNVNNNNENDVHHDEEVTEEQEEKENSNYPVAHQTSKSSTILQKSSKEGSESTKRQAMKKSLKKAPLDYQDVETEDESETSRLSLNADRTAHTRMSLRRKSKCLDYKSSSRKSSKVIKLDIESPGNKSFSSSPEKAEKGKKGKNKSKKKLYNEQVLMPRNSDNNGSPGKNDDLNEDDEERRNEDFRVPSTSTSRQKKPETEKIIAQKTESTTKKSKLAENSNDSMDLDEHLARIRHVNKESDISPKKRKVKKKSFWTIEEETKLAIAIKRLGPGRWAEIRQLANLKTRSSIDIKDKWRNINKSADKVKDFFDLAEEANS